METITIHSTGAVHEFDIDFLDLEVVEAIDKARDIAEEIQEAGDDPKKLIQGARKLLEQIDVALGDGASKTMFGNRTNLEKILDVYTQLSEGWSKAADVWSGKMTRKPPDTRKPEFSPEELVKLKLLLENQA